MKQNTEGNGSEEGSSSAAQKADLLVLCVKPYSLDDIIAKIRSCGVEAEAVYSVGEGYAEKMQQLFGKDSDKQEYAAAINAFTKGT